MLHLYDRASMARALTLSLDPRLKALLAERIEGLPDELIDWTEYLVIRSDDAEDDVVRAIGFSPLVEPMDGARYGEQGFRPAWDYLVDLGGWFEMIVTFGSTFAYVLFIQDAGTSQLRSMCQSFRDHQP